MRLPYSIREGLAGLRRARISAFTSISAMTVALTMIGLFAWLAYEAQQVSTWLRQRVGELEIFVEESAEDAAISAIRLQVDGTRGVAETEFVSRQDARRIFQEEFGEGADAFLDTPFLPASIKVRVAPVYAHPDSLEAIAGEFRSWDHVDEVVFNSALLAKVQENLRLLAMIGLLIGSIVVLTSIFLVANTIRLTMYARRLLIRTMKLVGATERFIRRPFVVEGMAQGMGSAVLAFLLLWGLYALSQRYLPQMTVFPNAWLLVALGGLALCGLALGWIGSRFAFRKVIGNISLH